MARPSAAKRMKGSADRDATLLEKTMELEKSKRELEGKVKELERFMRISVGRELKMIELKKRIKDLEFELSVKKAQQT